MLRVNCTPIDSARAARLVLGWLTEDRAAVDQAAGELFDEPEMVAGTLFAMADLAAHAVELADPDGAVTILRTFVLGVALADNGGQQ